jgi:hypothetical protein
LCGKWVLPIKKQTPSVISKWWIGAVGMEEHHSIDAPMGLGSGVTSTLLQVIISGG